MSARHFGRKSAAGISSLTLAAGLCVGAVATAPAALANGETPGRTIVSLGDSFISGEGAMYANKNFEGGLYKTSVGLATVTAGSDVLTRTKVSNELLLNTNGPQLGETVYELDSGGVIGVVKKVDSATKVTLTAPASKDYSGPVKAAKAEFVDKGFPYAGTPSIWQTAPGTLTGTYPNTMANWNSVYGDANGFPDSGGIQTLPTCARSYSSPGNIGAGWTHVNLACSGAIQPSAKHVVTKNGQFGTAFDAFKPGIDFMNEKNGPTSGTALVPADATVKGQAQLLKEYAQGNEVDVVAVSIGGNDFGFAPLIVDCALNFGSAGLFGKNCDPDKNPNPYLNDVNLAKVTAAVKTAVTNIDQAMQDAGKEPGSYRIVFQDPPLPIGGSAHNAYAESVAERQNLGGCGFKDKALDWIDGQLYPALVDAMGKGLAQAKDEIGATPVVRLVTKDAFRHHLLCGKDTKSELSYPVGQAGKNPVWSDGNGRDTEWVNFMSYSDQISNNYSLKSLPIHPNYWGQRALAACMALAVDTQFINGNLKCEQDPSEALDAEGRPAMKITHVTPLSGDMPFVSGRPTVTGNGFGIGDELSAHVSDEVFTPASDYAYEYQWLRDQEPIAGATSANYTLTADDADAMIAATVRANGAEATSLDVGPVASLIAVDGHYSLDGTAKVGQSLTVNGKAVTVTPAEAATNYAWLRDGEIIDGQTDASYTLTPADLGHEITAQLTLTANGSPDLVVDSDPAGPVAEGPMEAAGAPEIAGTATVGETLTASTPGVTFTPSAERVSYQWLRDDEPIAGETSATYELTGEDYSAKISVTATGHSLGYVEATTAASASTAPVKLGQITVLNPPTFDPAGPQVGRAVQVRLDNVFSEWASRPSIDWKVDGEVVGHGGEYTPKESDLGKVLTAEVTPDSLGYANPDSPATATATVGKLAPAPVTDPETGQETKTTVTGSPVVGRVLTAKAPAFDGPDTAVTYEWLRGGVKITGATASAYRVRVADAGKKLTARAVIAETPVSLGASSESSGVTAAKAVSVTVAKVTVSKRKAKVTITVTASGVTASQVTGKVVVKVGSKVMKSVNLVGGKAVAKFSVKPGKNKFTVAYAGSTGLKPSTSKAITIRVK